MTVADLAGRAVAVLVARRGEPPTGADEVVAEAGGYAVVVGDGARKAAGALVAATRAWWADAGPGLRPAWLARRLAGPVGTSPLVLLPASADGRDLAPRLAAELDRPLLAGAISAEHHTVGGTTAVRAELSRLDDRVLIPAEVAGPAVVTLTPGVRSAGPAVPREPPAELPGLDGFENVEGIADLADPDVAAVSDPDPATVDLGEAVRVISGGAGLAPPGTGDATARATFRLLADVAAALGASAGATRVVTDAGWMSHERQIGTTGVTVHPDLYLALGVSGAAQHVGGLGDPRHVVSVNTDASCPMTSMADLGLVTDARGLLVELARRLGVPVPEEVTDRCR